MDEREELAYIQGRQAAFLRMLNHLIVELHGKTDLTVEELLAERIDAIHALRRVCARFGDNEWPDNLYLSDIIEKHLERHLD
jgi:hypothetical protein